MKKLRCTFPFFSLLALGLLVGCSSNKTKDEALKPAELQPFDQKSTITYLFGSNVGALDQYYHQFQIATDASDLYAASKKGEVVKRDKLTGDIKFERKLKTKLTSALAIDNTHIYVGTLTGELVALSKVSGKTLWAKQLSSEIVSPPAVGSGHLIVQTNDGAVYDLNPESGEQRWRYDSNMPALTLRGTSRAAIFAPYAAIGFANGTLGIFDINTGQLRWLDRVTIPKGDTEIERLADVDAAPLIVGNRLFAVSYQGDLAAYNIESGKKIWSHEESSYKNIAAGGHNLYVTSDSGRITAYDQATGHVVWRQDGLLRRKPTSVAVAGDFLIVADSFGVMHVLDQKTGDFVGRRSLTLPKKPIPGHDKTLQAKRLMKAFPGIRVTAVADADRIYLLADNGQLLAFKLAAK